MSKIEWTDRTWNPVTGCTKVSSGCVNCYAERNFPRVYPGRDFSDIRLHRDRIEQPFHWKKPQKIFVCSMSDLFHKKVTKHFRMSVFSTIHQNPHLTFQVLTKRPERMCDFFTFYKNYLNLDPPENVWLGVTVENPASLWRIEQLLRIEAAVRFVSLEPLLEPVSLDYSFRRRGFSRNRLDWVIVGGESGPKARPMHLKWALDIRDQCLEAGTPYFFKQWGEWIPECHSVGMWREGRLGNPYRDTTIPQFAWPDRSSSIRFGKKKAGRILDGRTWDQFPENRR